MRLQSRYGPGVVVGGVVVGGVVVGGVMVGGVMVGGGAGVLVVLVGDGDEFAGVGAGVDGFGDADFRADGEADGLADSVVTAAGTTTAWEDTRSEGDGEADLREAVCPAEAGAVEEGAGAAGRS